MEFWGRILTFGAGVGFGARPALHHLFLPPKFGFEIDHINRDKLDNRRCNLRYATKSQNLVNRIFTKGKSKTGFVGVTPDRGGFKAHVTVMRKSICSGRFDSPESAALIRDAAAIKYFGQFAILNFPEKANNPVHLRPFDPFCRLNSLKAKCACGVCGKVLTVAGMGMHKRYHARGGL